MEQGLQLFFEPVRTEVHSITIEQVDKSLFGRLDDLVDVDSRRPEGRVPLAE
jgi:hypothetical protein